MKTAELEDKILDYYVALAVGHVWRRKWDQEDENYTSWQSYENGWGNPTPPYSTDWAWCGPLIERFEINLQLRAKAEDNSLWLTAYLGESLYIGFNPGRNPREAICRAVVALHFGQDVPDVKL